MIATKCILWFIFVHGEETSGRVSPVYLYYLKTVELGGLTTPQITTRQCWGLNAQKDRTSCEDAQEI